MSSRRPARVLHLRRGPGLPFKRTRTNVGSTNRETASFTVAPASPYASTPRNNVSAAASDQRGYSSPAAAPVSPLAGRVLPMGGSAATSTTYADAGYADRPGRGRDVASAVDRSAGAPPAANRRPDRRGNNLFGGDDGGNSGGGGGGGGASGGVSRSRGGVTVSGQVYSGVPTEAPQQATSTTGGGGAGRSMWERPGAREAAVRKSVFVPPVRRRGAPPARDLFKTRTDFLAHETVTSKRHGGGPRTDLNGDEVRSGAKGATFYTRRGVSRYDHTNAHRGSYNIFEVNDSPLSITPSQRFSTDRTSLQAEDKVRKQRQDHARFNRLATHQNEFMSRVFESETQRDAKDESRLRSRAIQRIKYLEGVAQQRGPLGV